MSNPRGVVRKVRKSGPVEPEEKKDRQGGKKGR